MYYTTNLQNVKVREALVSFLNQFDWDWFTTLTFKNSPKTYTAKNKLNSWIDTLESEENRKIGYYSTMEFTMLGVPHFHLLMGNLDGVSRRKWWEKWYNSNGRARILPYDQEKGASYYLSKYVVKDEYTGQQLWSIRGLGRLKQLRLDKFM